MATLPFIAICAEWSTSKNYGNLWLRERLKMKQDNIPEPKEPFSDKFYRKPDFQRVVRKYRQQQPPTDCTTNRRNLYCECLVYNPKSLVQKGICLSTPEYSDTSHGSRRWRVTGRRNSSGITAKWPVVAMADDVVTTDRQQVSGTRENRGKFRGDLHDGWRRKTDLTSWMRGFEVHSKRDRYGNFLRPYGAGDGVCPGKWCESSSKHWTSVGGSFEKTSRCSTGEGKPGAAVVVGRSHAVWGEIYLDFFHLNILIRLINAILLHFLETICDYGFKKLL